MDIFVFATSPAGKHLGLYVFVAGSAIGLFLMLRSK
jgi:hypothetical protein